MMNLQDEAMTHYNAEHQEADRERAYKRREAQFEFQPLVLPTVEIPERGLSDWFEDGLDEIFGEAINDRNADHAQDNMF